ncbi:hypothetical protein DFS33DRAFT_1278064 [Desarmillaria ectypa]|nr:hypothetical protein DFS33DRAFT_1278064 [Desarmillaria ectypa]
MEVSLEETPWDATKYSALLSLTQLLPTLEEFHIKHFSCIWLPHEFFSQLRKCTSVKKITFYDITFSSYSTFASIIRAFLNLEVLCLKLVSATFDLDSWSNIQDIAVVPQATFKTLDVNLSEEFPLQMCCDICKKVVAPVSIAQLHALWISGIKRLSHWDLTISMVQKSAQTLQSLQLDYIQTDVAGLHILPLPFLKHLHIHLNDFEEHSDVDVLRWWIRCFKDAATKSVHLEKITVTLKAYLHIYSLDRDRLAESEAPNSTVMLSMEEEMYILKQWFRYRDPSKEVFQDDIWCNLDACLPLLTDKLVIKFAWARAGDLFEDRINQLMEIIDSRMRRFKEVGCVLVFEVDPV